MYFLGCPVYSDVRSGHPLLGWGRHQSLTAYQLHLLHHQSSTESQLAAAANVPMCIRMSNTWAPVCQHLSVLHASTPHSACQTQSTAVGSMCIVEPGPLLPPRCETYAGGTATNDCAVNACMYDCDRAYASNQPERIALKIISQQLTQCLKLLCKSRL